MKKYGDSIQESILKYFNKISYNIHDNSQDYDNDNKNVINLNEDDNSISDYFIKHNKDIFGNINSEDTTNTYLIHNNKKDNASNNINNIKKNEVPLNNNNKNNITNNINASIKKKSIYNYYSRLKAHGWLLYYANLNCDLLCLKNKIIEKLRQFKLSHFIAAYNNNKGIYVHVKFIKYLNFDDAYSKKFNIIYKNKLYHPSAKTAVDWAEIDHLCKDTNNYIAYFNPNIPMQRRIKRIRLKINNIQSLIYNNDITDTEYIPRRKIWFSVPSNFDIINFGKSCFEDLYFKNVDNNWGDYKGEKVIIVSLLDQPYNNEISNMINLWSDDILFPVDDNILCHKPKYNKIILVSDKSINEYFESYDFNDVFFNKFEQIIMKEKYEKLIRIILTNDLFKNCTAL